ncbi:MAG: hypothetical protein NT019_00855 [Candidatus Adlerbacteria bacterium]|nr:hypothetical protein [Candidatus Adlerbacteria bacterium]
MKSRLLQLWLVARWPLGILLFLYSGLVLYRIPAVGEKQKTATAVAHIHAQKITVDDVVGEHLPPIPDVEANNRTVAGIDTNHNDIRDDVELAIFKAYPNSPQIRAAELQSAMAQQMFLTQVFNTETWKAAAQEDSRSDACIGLTTKDFKTYMSRTNEVKGLVFNTEIRKKQENYSYSFTTSYGSLQDSPCDIDTRML